MEHLHLSRFLSKVLIAEGGCWLWAASLTTKGYGKFSIGKQTIRAHRAAYEHFVGAIPSDLELDHTCRIRKCVNPGHLRLVTQRKNTLLGVSFSALNAGKSHCRNGHAFAGANLYDRPGGGRGCRTCRLAADQAYRKRKLTSLSG